MGSTNIYWCGESLPKVNKSVQVDEIKIVSNEGKKHNIEQGCHFQYTNDKSTEISNNMTDEVIKMTCSSSHHHWICKSELLVIHLTSFYLKTTYLSTRS